MDAAERTDELGHFTTYTYDDYRRLKSVTPPARGDGTHTTPILLRRQRGIPLTITNTPIQTRLGLNFPASKKSRPLYDDNRRKSTVTVAPGTGRATISYSYDNVGNLRMVTNPRARCHAPITTNGTGHTQ